MAENLAKQIQVADRPVRQAPKGTGCGLCGKTYACHPDVRGGVVILCNGDLVAVV
jgi:hypothetical protein